MESGGTEESFSGETQRLESWEKAAHSAVLISYSSTTFLKYLFITLVLVVV